MVQTLIFGFGFLLNILNSQGRSQILLVASSISITLLVIKSALRTETFPKLPQCFFTPTFCHQLLKSLLSSGFHYLTITTTCYQHYIIFECLAPLYNGWTQSCAIDLNPTFENYLISITCSLTYSLNNQSTLVESIETHSKQHSSIEF